MKNTVLIVDDMEMNREILKEIFKEDYNILEASDGKEALSLLGRHKIDIVLLDLIMDGMSGFDVLEVCSQRDDFSEIPFVVITGSEQSDDQLKAFELGAREFISKPFESMIVRTRVKNVLLHNQKMIEAKKEASDWKQKSEQDELTGFYNKAAVKEYVSQILEKSDGIRDVFFVIDIDHFKRVNDQYGHIVGDQVIKEISTMISEIFRKSDVIGRIGGAVFCVLMTGLPNYELARNKINQLLQIIEYDIEHRLPEGVSISVGMVTNEEKSCTYDDLYKKADESLFQAKSFGGGECKEYGVDKKLSDSKATSVDYFSKNFTVDGKEKKKTKILLVEDHEINRKIIKKIIQDKYEIIEACNGIEAIEKIQEHSDISVILLDIVMPKMNGYEVLEKLKELQKDHIPVIVLTGDDNENAESKALDLGAIDFIMKPVDAKVLISRVRNAVIRNQAFMLERLRKKSELDELTGLYNRLTLFGDIRRIIKKYPEKTFAFIRFDIDHFRLYNSAMGEAEGDTLLLYITDAMKKVVSEYEVCTYGRIDADIFGLCVPFEQELIEQHVELTQNTLANYRHDYSLNVTFGIYVIEDINESVEAMFTKASMASDKCKSQYNKKFMYFESSMEKEVQEELKITNKMTAALLNKEFAVYLQPKYKMDVEKTCGAEALVRWIDPQEGMISPGVFIPVFERNGFITKLDYYMWEEVCKLLHKWKMQGKELYPISVNISRISMYNTNLPEIIHDLVKKYDIEAKYLQLEITESAYMSNPELMTDIITNLQNYGFIILMDDFGSGYSSLNTLADINVDILKIDMKFMPQDEKDTKREKILSAIVRMAGWIGMSVVAEGVETKNQRNFLESIGCGYVQGFYYARPMPVDEFEALVTEENYKPTNDSVLKESQLDAVWTSAPEIEELMKGLTVPIGIFESSEHEIELVRANKEYFEYFHVLSDKQIFSSFGARNANKIVKTISKAAKADDPIECQIQFDDTNGQKRYYKIRLMKMGSIPKSDIVCAIFFDVTDEVEYKMQLVRIEKVIGNFERKKMLVIDDNEFSRRIVKSMFKDEYEVIEASNGIEGLALLKDQAEDIAIILLDMIMPELDGEGFLEEKNQLKEAVGIPIVVISAETSSDLQIKMLKQGVNDYVVKPFDPDVLKQRIHNGIMYNSRFQELLSEYRNR